MKKTATILIALSITGISFAQVGVGTSNPAGALDITSTVSGLVLPRVANTGVVINPNGSTLAEGTLVFDQSKGCIKVVTATGWSNCFFYTESTDITSLDCAGATTTGTLTENAVASGVSTSISYTGGNGGTHTGQVVTSTGVTGLTATLSAGNFAVGSGSLVYTITGTPAGSGTASFAVSIGGQTCSLSVPVAAVTAPLPANIVLSSISPYSVISTYDNDYLPYVTPTVAATLATNVAADGLVDAVIDVQGSITTTGVTVSIPYTVTGSSVTLPLFTQTITIPAGSTQDGISRDLTFSYTGATLAVGSGTITATLKAVGGTLNIKKLDVQTGIGNDDLGYLLGQFTYTTNNAGATANFDVRAKASMCGAYVAAGVYKEFMCHNLGADTSLDPNVPVQGIHGNYYQWGSSTVVANASTPSGSIAGWNTTAAANGSWLDASKTANDPCPVGFRVPTNAQWLGVIANNTVSRTGSWANDGNFTTAIHCGPNASTKTLTLPAAGYRSSTVGTLYFRGYYGSYWSSTENGTNAPYLYFYSSNASTNYSSLSSGFSVRCVSE